MTKALQGALTEAQHELRLRFDAEYCNAAIENIIPARTPASRELAKQDEVHLGAGEASDESLQPLLERQAFEKWYLRDHFNLNTSAASLAWSAWQEAGAATKRDLAYYKCIAERYTERLLHTAGAAGVLGDAALGNRTPARQEERSSEKEVGAAPLPVQGQELALQLKAFRDAHWTHWSEAENQLVINVFHALRSSSAPTTKQGD